MHDCFVQCRDYKIIFNEILKRMGIKHDEFKHRSIKAQIDFIDPGNSFKLKYNFVETPRKFIIAKL